jgi:ATP-binding cassette, subfamily B, bacterial HlyB/CyaB
MADAASPSQLLRAFPFLADQPDAVIEPMAAQAQLLRYRLGQPISRVQQSPGAMLFLIEGSVRSVVMADRLPQGVATLQKFGPGAVLAWSRLSCGRSAETLIAASRCVLLKVPEAVVEAVMEAHPPFAQRVHHSVNAAELFDVLDAYLRSYPRVLAQAVVQAARELAAAARVVELSPDQWQRLGPAGLQDRLPASSLWLVSAGERPLGSSDLRDSTGPAAPAGRSGVVLRLLGVEKAALEAVLEPAAPQPPEQGMVIQELVASEPVTSFDAVEANLLSQWQKHQELLQSGSVGVPQAPELPPREPVSSHPEGALQPEDCPFIAGRGALDSSLAAFRMLAMQLNLPFRREMLRRVFSDQVQRHGEVSLALCGAVGESIGLHTQLLELEATALRRLQPPLLLRWGDGVAVVWDANAKRVLLGIPADRTRLLSWEAFQEEWGTEGELLSLRVTDRTPRRRFGFAWFLPALRQHRTVLIEVLLASFFVQLFGLVNPLLIQQVIDKAIINSSPGALTVLGSLLVVFALFEGLLLCLRTFLFVDTTNRIDLDLGTSVIDHLLRLPLSYFDRRPVGEVSNRINELEKVRSFLTGTALTTVLDALFALLYVVVMLVYSWQLTLLVLLVVPLLAGVVLFASPIVRQQLQRRAIASARTQSHLVEVLSSMITVKAQNIELRSRWKWQDLYTDYVAEGFDNTIVSTVASTFNGFLNKLSSLMVIWGGAYLVLSGELTLGELIAFRIIAGYVTGPLLRMANVWQSIQETALSLERLADVIDHPEEAPEDNGSRLNMASIQGRIEFQDIEFRYQPSSPLLLKGVNLKIDQGAFVAVVGLSGSGKSTLTKLLTRLYNPEKGRVLIDDIDVSKVELYSLRRQIGVVPQETVLFEGSIEENIALTNPEATTEEVIEAARIACAHDFIMSLPAAYSNQVGERGSGLSGGQRQRIALARTILQKPNLLIMDEATSALDYQTERVVCDNLMKALKGRTVLFITHRLSSITAADSIVVMGDGVVLEQGSHAELIEARGAYYALYNQQSRSSSSSSHSVPAGTSLMAGLSTGEG